MNRFFTVVVCLSAVPVWGDAANVIVEGGSATFIVNTTVPGICVKGKSSALQAHAVVERDGGNLRVDKIEATIAVKSIATGMALRDEHMRRYIFTTSDGKMPDLRFEAPAVACGPQGERASDVTCQVKGELSIRGVARPFSLALKVRPDGAAYRASGDAIIELSDYGIEQPSQFGVKTSNEIQLRLEFTAKSAADVIAAGGR
jgi:polyisoprenoid-binding protein YceI